ncbi:uncharacterized protein BDR25DRAFT_373191 [Lindgomyces ingoldianus]|uniref:Uncharacterized protein n=1 Tax=Lindgomyces ingoldianus TaxID=673940 RepID=A0ACB6QP03_9PLEO|nr:uncharacterized protein BDR25DRAFT_373191 [Lindgomyces ingoldianus]KAF2468600.1 hypothetical protein BDR25DRAFT_373191 [Lindgomyces ingoldianus]
MAPSKVQEVETPFTTAAVALDIEFWQSYSTGHPNPTENFFKLTNGYYLSHRNPLTGVAHDVGTRPGNIASRLAPYFHRVVGSDVNEGDLTAAPAILRKEYLQQILSLPEAAIPEEVGKGKTDLIVVSECMPLLDATKALKSFHTMLRPGGSLAIYFYRRSIFTSEKASTLDVIYDRIATRICTFLLPFKGIPGFTFHSRAAEAMFSWLDSIAFLLMEWESTERRKWNNNIIPLLFNSKEGYDFEFERVDRRGEGEVTTEMIDRGLWAEE